MRAVVDSLRPVFFAAGEVICRQGEPGASMYIVAHGRVRVTLETPGGASRLLETMGRGDHFGDMSLLTDQVRTATVTAVVDSQLLQLEAAPFKALLISVPGFAVNLSRALVLRLQAETTRRKRRERPMVVGLVNTSPRTQRLIQPLAEALVARRDSLEVLTDRSEKWATDGRYLVERIPGELSGAERIDRVHVRVRQVLEHHTRIFLDLSPQGTAEELARMLAPCEDIWWLIEPRYVEAALEKLRLLLAAAPQLAQRLHVVWILPPSERFPPAHGAELPISPLSFKVTLGDDPHHASWRQRQGVQRLVHYLRGTRLGVALGGGGARGLAHLGAMRAFNREEIHFDLIAGTSSGALMGLSYAGGWRPDDALDEFARVLTPPRWVRAMPGGSRSYLWWQFRRGAWDALLRPYVENLTLEQLLLPFHVLTVDLVSGKQVVRERGDAIHAVLESINVPYLAQPIQRGGMALVDGGVLNNLPADVLSEHGANFVVGIDVASKLSPEFGVSVAKRGVSKRKRPGLLETLLRVGEVQVVAATAARMQSIDLLLTPDTSKFDFADFGRARELADVGEAAAEEAMPTLKQKLVELENNPDGI